mgnify:CR=1 FL=1
MIEKIKEKWDEILLHIKEEHELTDVSFKTWLLPTQPYSMKDGTLQILVPDVQFLGYIKKKYGLLIQITIEELTGIECEVDFVTIEQVDEPQKETDKSHLINRPSEVSRKLIQDANLNPRYTFDTFVVGANNNLAHAASLAVAESPGEIYNPLFIYGGVGLGKTHLMHSIGHFILKNNPKAKVLYVTSEKFTNELIDAIRNKNNITTTEFREKYRNIDVLLIDDVQFIIGKESTQEEFFHTFNTLHGANKQIILSSDRPPKDMDILEDRIRSRFEWGLLADIQSPDYETRIAILRKKQELDGYSVSDDVIEYIASNIKSNIRELEGALNKIIAYANLEKREINIDLAEQVLRDIISPNEKKVITPEFIIDTVADHFDITPSDIVGSKRSSKIVFPRQIAMYLCREMLDAPLTGIGKMMGDRDHTTVMHGIEKIEKEMSAKDSVRNTVDILKKKINPSK